MTRGTHRLPGLDVDPESMLAAAWTYKEREDDEHLDKTTYRIHSRDGIRVCITPMILPVATYLLADIESGVSHLVHR